MFLLGCSGFGSFCRICVGRVGVVIGGFLLFQALVLASFLTGS